MNNLSGWLRVRGRTVLALHALIVSSVLFAFVADTPASAKRDRPDPAVTAAVDQLLARISEVQETVDSFRAKVTETRSLALLAEDEVLTGTLSYAKPGKMRWEYDAPEHRIYVLAEGQLTGCLPDARRIEKLDLGRHEKRLRRLVALGQDGSSLRREFRIDAELDAETGKVDHLILVPRSRRVRKRMARVQIWFDEANALPERIHYETGDGDQVDLRLDGIVVNPDLSAETFIVEEPTGWEIVEGESSLSFGSGG